MPRLATPGTMNVHGHHGYGYGHRPTTRSRHERTALMTTVALPTASAGARRGFGIDPRLLIGLGLVLASVAGVVGVVSAADSTIDVYAADGPLTPGDRILPGDLIRRSVTLDGADGLYLRPGDIPADGVIVSQPIGDGELVPSAAVGSILGATSTTLVIESSTRIGAGIRPGATVDIWAAIATESAIGVRTGAGTGAGTETDSAAGATSVPPAVLVPGATVVRIVEDEGGMTIDSTAVAVEVLVPKSSVARLLQATADGAALSLVPTGLPIAATDAADGAAG